MAHSQEREKVLVMESPLAQQVKAKEVGQQGVSESALWAAQKARLAAPSEAALQAQQGAD